ncbi:MAG: glucose 1-dehydrogenase [Leptospiraceae bacterium]|nr:glucose 1-dehydrogenase [Leptospiraceae bacterium]MCP5513189.1 glucose 1-dehydrogenase [Leptospiraceae bacterium]
MKFHDKIALVTGGTSGLGKAIALELAKDGATVVLSGRREKEGNEVVSEIQSKSGSAMFVKADVSKASDVELMVQSILSKYGKLDIAVNNAGTIGKNKLIHQYEESDYDDVINVNLKGVWVCMKYEIPEMLAAKSGVIVNVSSVSGLIGFPYNSLYSASKHGVIGLTKSAALEFGHKGIRINAVCPGGIETDMLDNIFQSTGKPSETKENMTKLHSLRRLASPQEVAKAVVFLCSEDSSFIHGSAIPVDGGWTAH